jgi:hypothetical protein
MANPAPLLVLQHATASSRRGNDDITSGAGRDKVKADRTDSVKNCEFVKRAVRRARRR